MDKHEQAAAINRFITGLMNVLRTQPVPGFRTPAKVHVVNEAYTLRESGGTTLYPAQMLVTVDGLEFWLTPEVQPAGGQELTTRP